MRRKILVWIKRPFLLVFWFFKRIACHIPLIGKKLMRKSKKVYETHISELLKFKNESPLNHLASPPWYLRISGTCLVLSKYLSLMMYNEARSYRWQEIYGFILGKRLGDLFVGIIFIPVTNILCSATEAAPDLFHLWELKNVIASRYPELEIICTCHSHPSGVLLASNKDLKCFKNETTPNLIISPRRLLFGSPIKRMVAYHNFLGKVRRIKLFEIDKKEPDIEDIDFKELQPSKEELINIRELATEIDFEIYKIWMVSHPNLSLKKLSQKLSEMFGKKIGFVFLCKEDEWIYNPDMKVIDYYLKDGPHLVFPEFFEEVK
jgi:proteasome lid subunit RPN8/RPN11